MNTTTLPQLTDEQLLECADKLEGATYRMHSQAWQPSRKAVRFLQYLAKDRTFSEKDAVLIRILVDELTRFSQAVSPQTCQCMLEAAEALQSVLPA